MNLLRVLSLFIFFLVSFSCKTNTHFVSNKTVKQAKVMQLRFLSEYVFPANRKIKKTEIGGLSGIDYVGKNKYYLVCDDPNQPRVFEAEIKIDNDTITNVVFTNAILLDKENTLFYKKNHLDLESIVVDKNSLFITSEGSIKRGKDPAFFQCSAQGTFIGSFKLPEKFLANSIQKPRHNGTLEGLSKSYNKKGFWTAFEFPLKADGKKPSFKKNNSLVRFTYFDKNLKKATKEFSYRLEKIPRKKTGLVNLNGLTDIIEYKKNNFFVIERTFQSGYKDKNIIKIFRAIINKKTTNTLKIDALKNKKNVVPMTKKLAFDFSTVKDKLTNLSVDNIEGITFGPKLSNGNKSLILVSDDNFNRYGKQLNQFILLEIVYK